MNSIIKFLATAAIGMGLLAGCSSLDYDPRASVDESQAVTSFTTALAATYGMYDQMQDTDLEFDGHLSMAQMFSDEMDHTGTFPTRLEFGSFNVFPANTTMFNVFNDWYDVINVANENIARIGALTEADDASMTPEVVNSFVGEARMIRAYCYWNLVNGWGDVPLILEPTTEVSDALFVTKNTAAEVKAQILSDLQFAQENVQTTSRSRANANAATVMLARFYLYEGNYPSALAQANMIINSGSYSLQSDYNDIFEGGNSEQIWYLNFTEVDGNSNAFFYYPSSLGGRLSVAPSDTLLASYEAGDLRFNASFGGGGAYGNKYRDIATGADPIYLMRYAEVLLIAAEANAAAGSFAAADTLINAVRSRAGLGDVNTTADNYLDLILQERYVELAMEGPHRLWDLRRTGRAVDVLGYLGYEACDNIWPLPQNEIDRNPNLVQNPACNQ